MLCRVGQVLEGQANPLSTGQTMTRMNPSKYSRHPLLISLTTSERN